MARRSAGILFYRRGRDGVSVLLVHPGGPFWARRETGAWQLPKGEIGAGEDAEAAARREAREELGVVVTAALRPLGTVRQAGGKHVEAFAAEQAIDAGAIASATFEMEWPRGSGVMRAFPEVDAARWFTPEEAGTMMLASQRPFLDRLLALADAAR